MNLICRLWPWLWIAGCLVGYLLQYGAVWTLIVRKLIGPVP